jgi:hypothetical protein
MQKKWTRAKNYQMSKNGWYNYLDFIIINSHEQHTNTTGTCI